MKKDDVIKRMRSNEALEESEHPFYTGMKTLKGLLK